MRVIVALDGSHCSMAALDFMLTRPWLAEDEFMVLSVVEPVPMEYGLGYVPPPTELHDQAYQDCVRIVERSEAKLRKALPENWIEARVEQGFVAQGICDLANQWNAELIVMGSHGRTGIKHFLLGSVAEEVLKKSPCTVEVVKTIETGTNVKKDKQKAKAGSKR